MIQIPGKIKAIFESKQVSDSFTTQEIALTTHEQYPQHLLIQFSNAHISHLQNCVVGQNVLVTVALQGREWTNPQGEVKYFNTIKGLSVREM